MSVGIWARCAFSTVQWTLTYCVDVRRHRAQRLALVAQNGFRRVEALDLEVGIDGDENVRHVGVDLVPEEAHADVLEQGRLVEVDEGAVVVHIDQLGALAASAPARQVVEI